MIDGRDSMYPTFRRGGQARSCSIWLIISVTWAAQPCRVPFCVHAATPSPSSRSDAQAGTAPSLNPQECAPSYVEIDTCAPSRSWAPTSMSLWARCCLGCWLPLCKLNNLITTCPAPYMDDLQRVWDHDYADLSIHVSLPKGPSTNSMDSERVFPPILTPFKSIDDDAHRSGHCCELCVRWSQHKTLTSILLCQPKVLGHDTCYLELAHDLLLPDHQLRQPPRAGRLSLVSCSKRFNDPSDSPIAICRSFDVCEPSRSGFGWVLT